MMNIEKTIVNCKCRRFVSMLLAALLAVTLLLPTALPVRAENRLFISELRVAAGEDAVSKLEEDGWSVMMTGLNVTSEPAEQVYLAYKMNTGSPITNVILSPDVGKSVKDKNGIVYTCVSHVDVDEGIEGSSGCLYATHDERAGAPLVGLDVVRGSTEDEKALYTISNDGAEIVRTQDGKPADLENAKSKGVVYLFQIRDGIVRPYIREIGVVTDTNKWNAVYTACERGYNYYVEGDIDDSSETYTILAYERTADPAEAVTSITAVSEETVKALEEGQIIDGAAENAERVTAEAISISGAEYVRVSSQPIRASEPYYLYRTKDAAAGNPIFMLYAETPEETQNFLLGTWANSYFFVPGTTTAYTYSINEDLYMSLWEDQTVCCKLPVRIFDSYMSIEAASESEPDASEPDESEPDASEPDASEPDESEPDASEPEESEPDELKPDKSEPEESLREEPLSEEPLPEEPVSGEPAPEESVSEEPAPEEPVPGGAAEELMPGEPLPADPAAEEPVTGEPVREEPVPGEIVPEGPMAGEVLPADPAAGKPTQEDPANEFSVTEAHSMERTSTGTLFMEKPSADTLKMEAPSTEARRMRSLATEKHFAEAPSTEAFLVKASSSETRTMEKTSVQKPAMKKMVMKEPAAEEAAMEKLAMEEPAPEDLVMREPAMGEPSMEEPRPEDIFQEEPRSEEPLPEEPRQEEPRPEEPSAEEPVTEVPLVEAPPETVRYINLMMLTRRDGLPASAGRITGLRGDPAAPYIERTERSERVNKYQASVFGNGGGLVLIIGGALALAAGAIICKIRFAKKKAEKPKE